MKRIEKTRSESSLFASKPESDAPVWLQEQVYMPKRQRTIDLARQSVDALRKDKQRVSLATVVAKSKELDTEGNGKGISESAILDNQEARAYYEQHRSWQGSSRKRAKPLVVASSVQLLAIKPGRDEQRVRQRYLRMSKEALVERLITTERTLAEQRERWIGQQDEVLTWRLRAETAEAQAQMHKEKPLPDSNERTDQGEGHPAYGRRSIADSPPDHRQHKNEREGCVGAFHNECMEAHTSKCDDA